MEVNTNQDYLRFKNDILKDIRMFEKGINDIIKNKNSELNTSLLELEDKIEKISKEAKTSTLSIIEITSKLNRFSDYFIFKQRIENTGLNHDIKLKVLSDENEKIKIKLDKIINENLLVPGVIGGTCKYKNLKDYIYNNNNEISKVRSSVEEQKRITTDVKKKIEVLPKNMVSMVESAVRRSNEFTEHKLNDFEKLIDEKISNFNQKITETKTEMIENKKYLDETVNNLREDINKYTNIKSEIISIINENESKSKEIEKERNEIIKKLKEEIEEVKKSRSKYNNQIINNTQLINEIKYKLKTMKNVVNNFRNIRNDNNNSFNYNNKNYGMNNSNYPDPSIVANKNENENINRSNLKEEKNNPYRKLSFKEKNNSNFLKTFYFSEGKNTKFSKETDNNKYESPPQKNKETIKIKPKMKSSKIVNALIEKKENEKREEKKESMNNLKKDES